MIFGKMLYSPPRVRTEEALLADNDFSPDR